MKKKLKVVCNVFNWKSSGLDGHSYHVAISEPWAWHFKVSNGAISYYGSDAPSAGYKTKKQAMNAAKSFKKNAKALGMI
jgi:uncharacterized protein YegP (UPF0339 family)